jgi:HPt (histidine-containing phosphotransfer) domain-containing protein
MNIRALAENLEMELEEIEEVLKLFLETSVSHLNILRAALVQGNLHEVAEVAQAIKAAAIDLGLQGIYKAAKEIETKATKNILGDLQKSADILQGKLVHLGETLKAKSFNIS